MRRFLVIGATILSFTNPTGISPLAAIPVAIAAAQPAQAQAEQQVTVPNVHFDIKQTDPFHVDTKAPDFENDVIKPLRAEQAAEKAAELAAEQAALAATRKPVVVIDTGDAWAQLRFCESGGNYADNTGNGFYGAYQFDYGTWGGYGGYATADQAPPAVQDAKAQATQAARGWYPWPACARKLGLI